MGNPNTLGTGAQQEAGAQRSEGALHRLGDALVHAADFLGDHGLNMVPVKAVPSEHAVHDGPRVNPVDAHAGEHPTWQGYGPHNLGR